MSEFLTNYGAGLLVCCVGLFFIIMTYGAFFTGRSGVPLCGGVLIAFGFLITPSKHLALLGFIDPGWYMLVYMIYENYQRQCIIDKFRMIYTEKGFESGEAYEGVKLTVAVKELDEERVYDYETCHVYGLNTPKIYFALCCDCNGDIFLLTYTGRKGSSIGITSFEDGMTVSVNGGKDRSYTVMLGIVYPESEDEDEDEEDSIS